MLQRVEQLHTQIPMVLIHDLHLHIRAGIRFIHLRVMGHLHRIELEMLNIWLLAEVEEEGVLPQVLDLEDEVDELEEY